ncbi:Arc family DNA-binding protein [Diaphorobacter nitroreducens]|uniref:Arc family DNA-binding protein n=1 Tax=Diaphorobacter nitroreducens TaxID=164759 RepID=UPI0028AB440F|nr:Arc family DNA-binding protein [Diaphorobacter nitroreducens]
MTDRHQQKPYPLRMPDELRTKLEQAAQAGSRSLHAEILARLEASFPSAHDGRNVPISLEVRTADLAARVAALERRLTHPEEVAAFHAWLSSPETLAKLSESFDAPEDEDIRKFFQTPQGVRAMRAFVKTSEADRLIQEILTSERAALDKLKLKTKQASRPSKKD